MEAAGGPIASEGRGLWEEPPINAHSCWREHDAIPGDGDYRFQQRYGAVRAGGTVSAIASLTLFGGEWFDRAELNQPRV